MACEKRQQEAKHEDLRTEDAPAEMSFGDAALALGAHWSGETQIREAVAPEALAQALGSVTLNRTVRGVRLLAALLLPLKRQVAASDRRLDGLAERLAALESEVRGPEPRMPKASVLEAAPRDPESIEVGDTFRWLGGDRDGSICEVTAIHGDMVRLALPAIGKHGATSFEYPRSTVLATDLFERVRAVEVAPSEEAAQVKAGDKFRRARGPRAGRVFEVIEVDGPFASVREGTSLGWSE